MAKSVCLADTFSAIFVLRFKRNVLNLKKKQNKFYLITCIREDTHKKSGLFSGRTTKVYPPYTNGYSVYENGNNFFSLPLLLAGRLLLD